MYVSPSSETVGSASASAGCATPSQSYSRSPSYVLMICSESDASDVLFASHVTGSALYGYVYESLSVYPWLVNGNQQPTDGMCLFL